MNIILRSVLAGLFASCIAFSGMFVLFTSINHIDRMDKAGRLSKLELYLTVIALLIGCGVSFGSAFDLFKGAELIHAVFYISAAVFMIPLVGILISFFSGHGEGR